MEHVRVGIDVSKDRLDIHVLRWLTFAVTRDGEGLEDLVERLRVLAWRR